MPGDPADPRARRRWPAAARSRSTPETLAGYDAVLIATDHDGVDYAAIVEHAALIVDTRNAFARRGLARDKVVGRKPASPRLPIGGSAITSRILAAAAPPMVVLRIA